MLESTLIDRIRHIFLHPRPHVSISSATALLGWSRAQMKEAIATGEIVLMETPLGKWVWREELMAKALERWPNEVVEEALGSDADRVLSKAVRLAELRARSPRYQLAMLQYLAEQQRTTARALELARVLPGFVAALEWPDGEAQLPC